MHTIDGAPAIAHEDANGLWISFATGKTRATVLATLREIRRDHRRAIRTANYWFENVNGKARASRYGYVLVEVPADV